MESRSDFSTEGSSGSVHTNSVVGDTELGLTGLDQGALKVMDLSDRESPKRRFSQNRRLWQIHP